MSCEKRKDKPFLGTREILEDKSRGCYRFRTYGQVLELTTKVGSGIVNLDLAPVTDSVNNSNLRLVGVYAKNREEWVELDLACILYGFTLVPIYDTLGHNSVEYVFNHTKMETCFCSCNYLENLLKSKSEKKFPHLKSLVSFDEVTEKDLETAKQVGINLYSWSQLISKGENKRDYTRVTKDNIYTFAYTSGTTGDPKAAMISHGNIVATVAAIDEIEDFA